MRVGKLLVGTWLAVFTLLCVNLAQAQQPVRDKEYKVLPQPHKTDTSKILVLEFFSYACPHCADFEPYLQDWVKRKPSDVEYRMIPMVFRDNWKPLAKLFYTLENMRLLDQYHMKVFDAIHKQGQQLFTDDAVLAWVGKQGLDKAKFQQVYSSFGIDTKVQRGMALARAYGVQFTPSVGVNGKYWTGPSMVTSGGGPDTRRFFTVLDQLIAMERGKPTAAIKTPDRKG